MANPTATFVKEKLGGPKAAAEKIARKPQAIRMWVFRRAIPRSVWPDLVDAYDHLTFDDLKAVEDAEKSA